MASAPPFPASRLLSLDVLRGLTIAGMILVTDPGTYAHVYRQLTHAPWNDPTVTDLIFPCFLFMVGLSMVLSFAARVQRGDGRKALAVHVVRRSALLIGLGLIVNGFPTYDLPHMRLPGILQRIGVCYLVVGLLWLLLYRPAVTRRMRVSTLALVGVVLLAVYWLLLRVYPTPGFGPGRLDPLGNVASVLDRAVITVPHMFQWGVKTPGFGITFDPEGILSTLGALGTTICGVLAGEVLTDGDGRRRQAGLLASAGTLVWLLSLGLRHLLPLNKQIYTPTFALWSAGLSSVVFALLLYVIDVRRVRRGWTLALIFGTNAIFAFCLSQFVTTLLSLWRVSSPEGKLPLYMAMDARLFATWLPARPASLAWAVGVVLLNAAVIYPLYRRRVFLRL